MPMSTEDSERLSRVGPGSPMGELMRRYWLPALLSEELPEPDCPPIRTRLLGENLVAFRDTNGRVGLLAENCAHRRASLFYGRNEECGLRCIYHGWKYDVDGNVLDTPAEPAESMIRHHVKHTAYPCREINGLVWTYMGPQERMPPMPDFPWFKLPRENIDVGSKFFIECNWLQCLEGDNDSVHSAYLHRRGRGGRWLPPAPESPERAEQRLARDRPAKVELDVGRWGVRAATMHPINSDRVFVRTNTFIMPCFGDTPAGGGQLNEGMRVHFQVPADDDSNWRYDMEVYWNRKAGANELRNRAEVGPGFHKLFNRDNDYRIDREKQRSGEIYCGIDAGNHTQDACVTETMGVITDRSQEHLGVSDLHIIAIRDFLLKAVRDVEEGRDPPGVFRDPEENQIGNWCHMLTATIPVGKDWRELLPKD